MGGPPMELIAWTANHRGARTFRPLSGPINWQTKKYSNEIQQPYNRLAFGPSPFLPVMHREGSCAGSAPCGGFDPGGSWKRPGSISYAAPPGEAVRAYG